jgi:hypothetical protein
MGIKVARFDMLSNQVDLRVHDGKNGQPVEGEAKEIMREQRDKGQRTY